MDQVVGHHLRGDRLGAVRPEVTGGARPVRRAVRRDRRGLLQHAVLQTHTVCSDWVTVKHTQSIVTGSLSNTHSL